MENLGLKEVTGKICETKELCVHVNIALELCIGYRAGWGSEVKEIVEERDSERGWIGREGQPSPAKIFCSIGLDEC